jgi:hypothetical protein
MFGLSNGVIVIKVRQRKRLQSTKLYSIILIKKPTFVALVGHGCVATVARFQLAGAAEHHVAIA